MTRKRYVKLLMGTCIDRRDAQYLAPRMISLYGSYRLASEIQKNGPDLYKAVASQMFNIHYLRVTYEQRLAAKKRVLYEAYVSPEYRNIRQINY